jgi:medium-chain acyl-[acyl-carrier-protein] hydrolase
MERPAATRWLSFPPALGAGQGVAFCLPFAGGGASFYRAWAQFVPPSIALCPVQLPGREERLFEQPFDRLQPLVAAAADELLPFLPNRYVLFGHSMGALVSYELAQALRDRGAPLPLHLFVSGAPAPHRAGESEPIYALPEDQFLAALARYGGLPEEVLRSRELLNLLLPRLRADLAVTGTYTYTARPPLDCPITAFGGSDDPAVPRDTLEAWGEHTLGAFEAELFPGGHFFVNAIARHVVTRIAAALV